MVDEVIYLTLGSIGNRSLNVKLSVSVYVINVFGLIWCLPVL